MERRVRVERNEDGGPDCILAEAEYGRDRVWCMGFSGGDLTGRQEQ